MIQVAVRLLLRIDLLCQGRLVTSVALPNGYVFLRVGSCDAHSEGKHHDYFFHFLVCRFYEPTTGQLLIDGRDARERSQLWLHSSIGYVLQTPHLFSGTIRENLLMGKPDATEEEIWAAVKAVSADEVIAHLENGLDTDVGEGGDLLSTGEKQLISFARAVLADPRILILDEATASVDTITEAKIQAALDSVTQGRTSLMIAHRLSTVRNADLILVVRNGKIVEQGTHKELIRMRGYYYELYTRQYEDEATAQLLA